MHKIDLLSNSEMQEQKGYNKTKIGIMFLYSGIGDSME